MKIAGGVKPKDGLPTEIRIAAEEFSVAGRQDHNASTVTFLSLSKSLLQILASLFCMFSSLMHQLTNKQFGGLQCLRVTWLVDRLPLVSLPHAESSCLILLPDKIGPTMAVLSLDVHRNIERLEKIYLLDPSHYLSVGEILKKEVDDGTARKRGSCTKAVLWLTRSMNFSLALIKNIEKDSEWDLEQIVEESYKSTLKPWHGWISSAAYRVVLKLLPEKEIFSSLLMSKGQDCNILKVDIQKFVSLLRPFLDEINAILRKLRLDRMKSS